MNGPYDDIIHLQRPFSKKRKRMSLSDRAAQFSPFAALTGFDAAIQEAQRVTEECVLPDGDGIAILDRRLLELVENQKRHYGVTVTYFLPDQKKAGGAYFTHSGRVQRVDGDKQRILFEDGMEVYFSSIREINGDFFTE